MKSTNSISPEKRSPVRRLLLLSCCAIVGVVVWYVASGGLSDPTNDIVDAGSGEAKVIEELSNNATDLIIDLTGNNTDIKWTGSNSIGQTPTGYFYELTGNVVIDGTSHELKKFEVLIDMDGVKAMASSLTKKLKHKGFFEVDKFPTAEFVSTSISHQPDPDSPEGTTSIVEGNFKLRDVTRSIRIPAKVSSDGTTFALESKFKINRRDYGVVYSDSTGDALIRDAVMIEINIDTATSDEKTEDSIPNNLAGNPETQTSTPAKQKLENYTETVKATLVEFDMILVPGDQAKEVEPFWIGKTEVTWNEFDYWALCKNMADKDSINEISQLLRPSSPHDLEKIYRGWGRDKQPVVGISKLSAELYCKWLSQQTGKTYRLPTATEWDHAFESGGRTLGGKLDSEELSKIAWFDENALSTDDEGFDFERAMPVGTLEPDAMGIHDMLGNASEWVTVKDGQGVVRGGHFKLSSDTLIGSHQEAEDQNVWNKDYPQEPKSKWWYVNADYVGFRVVCEPEGK